MGKQNKENTSHAAPVTIHDFSPGQEVYVVCEETGMNTEDRVERLTVVSVGRKYVKAALDDPN